MLTVKVSASIDADSNKPIGTLPTMNDETNDETNDQENEEINYKNNPLNGVGLKKLVTELKDHYGFDILFSYLNLNCFNNNPSVESSVKFLKKTDWAREKVEGFYLYTFKSLPKASHQQSQLPPRDRIIPNEQTAGEPLELSLEDAEQLRNERELKAAEFDSNKGSRKRGDSLKKVTSTANNPWGISKK